MANSGLAQSILGLPYSPNGLIHISELAGPIAKALQDP
jgi:hypothetical protein